MVQNTILWHSGTLLQLLTFTFYNNYSNFLRCYGALTYIFCSWLATFGKLQISKVMWTIPLWISQSFIACDDGDRDSHGAGRFLLGRGRTLSLSVQRRVKSSDIS